MIDVRVCPQERTERSKGAGPEYRVRCAKFRDAGERPPMDLLQLARASAGTPL